MFPFEAQSPAPSRRCPTPGAYLHTQARPSKPGDLCGSGGACGSGLTPLPGVGTPGLCHYVHPLWLKVQSQGSLFLGNEMCRSMAYGLLQRHTGEGRRPCVVGVCSFIFIAVWQKSKDKTSHAGRGQENALNSSQLVSRALHSHGVYS